MGDSYPQRSVPLNMAWNESHPLYFVKNKTKKKTCYNSSMYVFELWVQRPHLINPINN